MPGAPGRENRIRITQDTNKPGSKPFEARLLRRTTATSPASAGVAASLLKSAMQDNAPHATHVVGRSSEGVEVRGTPLRVSRHSIVFEIYRQDALLQVSEVLSGFKIVLNDRPLYEGRAIIKGVVDRGVTLACEASLDDGWLDVNFADGGVNSAHVRGEFRRFLGQWEQFYRVSPEFKVIVADLETFLAELQLWTEQVELGIRCEPSGDRLACERELAQELSELAHPALDALFEKFEAIAAVIPPELQPAHQHFIRRQLHPMVLASPFAFRVVRKPLGYAGDYEMVNMILRDPHEGPSLFGKILNRWFIKQPPAQAHRNRVQHLTRVLTEETLRALSQQRSLRVYNVGCGPAGEIQAFFAQSDLAEHAQFTLLDFNEETLQSVRGILEAARAARHRSTPMQFVKKSVAQLIKGRSKVIDSPQHRYDLVYCAGLFDYLEGALCKQLMNMFYEMLAPGGLLLVSNVDPSNPIRHWLGYILEWHLIYRDGRQMLALRPDAASVEDTRVRSDITGVNVFLEVRRPLP